MLSPVQELYDFRRTDGEEFFKPIAYSVSKSALYNLTRYLATYWATSGVHVNTLTLAGVWNDQSAEFIDAVSTPELVAVLLLHLSAVNNTPAVACAATRRGIHRRARKASLAAAVRSASSPAIGRGEPLQIALAI